MLRWDEASYATQAAQCHSITANDALLLMAMSFLVELPNIAMTACRTPMLYAMSDLEKGHEGQGWAKTGGPRS